MSARSGPRVLHRRNRAVTTPSRWRQRRDGPWWPGLESAWRLLDASTAATYAGRPAGDSSGLAPPLPAHPWGRPDVISLYALDELTAILTRRSGTSVTTDMAPERSPTPGYS